MILDFVNNFLSNVCVFRDSSTRNKSALTWSDKGVKMYLQPNSNNVLNYFICEITKVDWPKVVKIHCILNLGNKNNESLIDSFSNRANDETYTNEAKSISNNTF